MRGAPVWDDGHVREWVGTCTDITDRKRAETEVLTWKNRYDAAVRASRQLLYDWDMVGDWVTYAGNSEAVVGRSLQEIQGGKLKRWSEWVHPEDRESFLQYVQEIQRTHQSFQVEYRLRQKDGTYRVVQDNGQCYLDESGKGFRMTGFVADITRRVETERRLRASEERFRRIFEECGVGMVVMDLNQRILQVNSAYCRFFGYTEPELREMRERDLVCADDLPEYERGIANVLSGKQRVLDMDKRCIRKDGKLVWAH